jgi:hypothetical protein
MKENIIGNSGRQPRMPVPVSHEGFVHGSEGDKKVC